MIAVLAIMLIMLGMASPFIVQMVSNTARQGAVQVTMGTLERARAHALQTNLDTYVGFADATFPGPESFRYKAMIIFREATDAERAETIEREFVPLGGWEILPGAASFTSAQTSLLNGGFTVEVGPADNFPHLRGITWNMPVVKFNGTGMVEQPVSRNNRRLFIYEGAFASGKDRYLHASQTATTALLDKIVLSRFTGRARLEQANPSIPE